MRRSVFLFFSVGAMAIFLVVAPLPTGPLSLGSAISLAQERWKAEFDKICSKTDVAMTLSTVELRGLIERCNNLKPEIEAKEESTRKVYLRRLQMCSDLYKFVHESKKSK